jgi:Tol biopolymer transport system component
LFVLLFQGCSDDDSFNEIYLEGEPIPGVEIVFPLGLYDGEPLMPKISPNGKMLLFKGPTSLPDWKGLWVMDLETKEKILLHPDGKIGDWAPDSEWIAFNINTNIYKIKKDGSNLTQLTFEGRNFYPAWSGDSNLIAYDNTSCGSQSQPPPPNSCGILICDHEGSNKNFLVRGRIPSWGLDNHYLIYNGLHSELFMFTFSDSVSLQLTTLNLDSASFNEIRSIDTYSETEKVLFHNSNGIYYFDLRSGSLERILPNELYNSTISPEFYFAYPSWHPDGEHIIYEHFEITHTKRYTDKTHVEGSIKFYKVNAAAAVATSNLPLE